METFIAVITRADLNVLTKIIDPAVVMDVVTTPNDAINNGALVSLALTPDKIRSFLREIDAAGDVPNTEYDQGDISELYMNVSYAWEQYEDSKGLVD